MLVFLDTEYTDPLNCDLISIGMISEDGKQTLYIESSDFTDNWCNSFVRATVLPQLGFASPALDREQMRKKLLMWFATLPRSITIACDSYTDWKLLLDAVGGHRPKNLLGRYDLRTLIDTATFHRAVVRYHEKHGPWHHALHDARAHRDGWLAWKDAPLAPATCREH